MEQSVGVVSRSFAGEEVFEIGSHITELEREAIKAMRGEHASEVNQS